LSWKKFTYNILLFLTPVLLFGVATELLVRAIPSGIKTAAAYMKLERQEITTLVLGASQNQRAINPAFLSEKTLTLAGTRQGHKTDYYLLKELQPQLPKLKKIILACTYRHLESIPNRKNFWKYNSHLYYLNANAFNRYTYFKDKLLFLANPHFYSKQLKEHYIKGHTFKYNHFGFQVDTIKSRFSKLKYNDKEIKKTYKSTHLPINVSYLKNNSLWLDRILKYCENQNIEVIIALTPIYDHYEKSRDPNVLYRRDSVLKQKMAQYPKIKLFNEEKSTDYTIFDYANENHLNPRGAKKFSQKLNHFLKSNL